LFFIQSLPKLQTWIEKSEIGTCVIDIWTSKRKDSIFGMKYMFLNESFEREVRTVGILEFNRSHTGDCIREEYSAKIKLVGLEGKVL
jgi:hypothetical protein